MTTAGARCLWGCLLATALAAGAPARAGDVLEQLTADDGAAGDGFGCSVAIEGDVLVVGAVQDNVSGVADAGSVYVFQRDSTGWLQTRKLIAGDPAAGARLGFAIALSGNTFVVGAPADDDAGADTGAAYVFAGGPNFTQQAKLTATDAAAGDQLGYAVALYGDVAAVGAPFDSDRGTRSGAVYVFRRTGTNWTQEAKLTAGDGAAFDSFGFSVALDGATVLAGAPFDDDAGTSSGAAYVFRRASGVWSQSRKLAAGDARAGDQFGVSVALGGARAVIGARRADAGAIDAGAAYVFDAGTGSQQQKLTATSPGAGDLFGTAVSIDGTRLVVSARFDDDAGTDAGSAQLFARNAVVWQAGPLLLPEAPAAGDEAGVSAAVRDGRVAFGAWLDDLAAVDAGAAVVYGPGPPPPSPADLAVTKDDGRATIEPGDDVAYTITVTNLGPAAVTGARVVDDFPNKLIGVTWTRDGGVTGAGDIDDTIDLAAGGEAIYVATATLACDAVGSLVNTAGVVPPADPPDPNGGNDEATDTDTILPSPDLAVTQTCPPTVVPGETATCIVTVTNLGAGVARDVVLDHDIGTPTGPPCNAFPCALGDLPGGDSVDVEVSFDVPATPCCPRLPIVSLAKVSTASCDSDPANDSVQVSIPVVCADLAVTKTCPSSVIAGTTATCDITVTNLGAGIARAVVLDDDTGTPLDPPCDVFPCALGDLPGGDSVDVEVSFDVPSDCCPPLPSLIVTVTEVTTSSCDADPANDSVQVSIPVDCEADLAVAMTDVADPVVAGGDLGYVVKVDNIGPSAVCGAVVAGALPLDGMTWTCGATSGSSCEAAAGAGDLQERVDLLPGGAIDFVITGPTPGCLSTELINTVSVASPSSATDPNLANNSDTETTDVVAAPGVCATKDIFSLFPTEGGKVRYTVRLLRGGPFPQTDNPGDELVDILPPDLNLTSADASSGTVATFGNTVTWNGSIPAGSAVDVTIEAKIDKHTFDFVAMGKEICNQGDAFFDLDGDGVNESMILTDYPDLPGDADPTCFTVQTDTAPGIPAASELALATLALLLAAAAVRRLRR